MHARLAVFYKYPSFLRRSPGNCPPEDAEQSEKRELVAWKLQAATGVKIV